MAHTPRLLALESLEIARPCDADWAAMVGDERTRHCSLCEKSVHNLSDMTRPEAEAFVRANLVKGACVRLYRRADGKVVNGDCGRDAEFEMGDFLPLDESPAP
jgi:hypothetical protein